MKIAVIGAGISGNVAAYHLARHHEVTVYEAARYVGGHSHTHSIDWGGQRYAIDTGFIVFNERNYPRFSALLTELGVPSQESTMSFSVRDETSGLEYNGGSLSGLFAQPRNLVRPAFLRMLREVLRFNREAPALLESPGGELALEDYFAGRGYSRAFLEHYLIPMGAALWSTDPRDMRRFPSRFFVRFLHNHGMLALRDRPRWRVVQGGSARYVERLTRSFAERIRLACPVEAVRRWPDHVIVHARGLAPERYDAIFFACHSDQALALLQDPDARERAVLGPIRYRKNEAVLHTDARLLPRSPRAWAAWNYHRGTPARGVALTYFMNRLQSLDAPVPFLVTLNRTGDIEASRVLKRLSYAHPQFTPAAVLAQARHREINGPLRTYFCGAYWGFGFHEDGVASARAAVSHFTEDLTPGRFEATATA